MLRLMFFMVMDDFLNDEIQESLGKFRVEIGLFRQVFETCDLMRFAGRIGRGKVVFGLEVANCLGVLKAFAQSIDEDRIQTVNALAVLFEQRGSAGNSVSQGPILSV